MIYYISLGFILNVYMLEKKRISLSLCEKGHMIKKQKMKNTYKHMSRNAIQKMAYKLINSMTQKPDQFYL